MTKRDAERAARRKLVLDTLNRAFNKMVPGRTQIIDVDLIKKKLVYNDNTPMGNLRHPLPFNLTPTEIILKGQKFKIGDMQGILVA
jgi:hypothetical protein